MWRRAAVVGAVTVLGTIAASTVSGYAANLSASANSLGGGKSSVPTCGSTVTVTPVIVSTNITQVTVASIPSSCGGGTAAAAVNNGSTSSSGTASVPSGGGSVTVTLATAVAFKDAYEADVTITGP